jgi:hypothetical protein
VAAKLHVDACILQRGGAIEIRTLLGQQHSRTPSPKQFRGGHSASRRSHHDDPPSAHRELVIRHTITAASTW